MSKITEVAVGVLQRILQRADGSTATEFLFAQRPEGKPYAGWWEFPGGKLEAGEPVEHALTRELREELGIEVTAQHGLILREHVYPHATVRLFFRVVTAWDGEPRSAEGQALCWSDLDSLEKLDPMLPAAWPVIDALRLPALIYRSNVAQIGLTKWLANFDNFLADRGSAILILHEPALSLSEFAVFFQQLSLRLSSSTESVGESSTARVLLYVSSTHAQCASDLVDGVLIDTTDAGARVYLDEVDRRKRLAVVCGFSELKTVADAGVSFALIDLRSVGDQPVDMDVEKNTNLIAQAQVPVFGIGEQPAYQLPWGFVQTLPENPS
jgi:mutator protein MutT